MGKSGELGYKDLFRVQLPLPQYFPYASFENIFYFFACMVVIGYLPGKSSRQTRIRLSGVLYRGRSAQPQAWCSNLTCLSLVYRAQTNKTTFAHCSYYSGLRAPKVCSSDTGKDFPLPVSDALVQKPVHRFPVLLLCFASGFNSPATQTTLTECLTGNMSPALSTHSRLFMLLRQKLTNPTKNRRPM